MSDGVCWFCVLHGRVPFIAATLYLFDLLLRRRVAHPAPRLLLQILPTTMVYP